jgi:hypothetical protein
MKYLILILALTSCCNNQNEVVILQSKLDLANKDILYYRTQYLKANTQKFAKRELDILEATTPDAIVTPFAKEEAESRNLHYIEDGFNECYYTILKDTKQLDNVFKYYDKK